MTGPALHPTAIIEAGARLGEGVTVGAYAYVGEHVELGDGCQVGAHALVHGHTTLGPDNRVHPHSVVGGPPQDLKYAGEPTRLVVGARNHFREGVTLNVGTEQGGGITRVGDDNTLMANAHVAHDCIVGNRCILANNVMLAGHVCVEDGAILNGGAGINQFTTVGTLSYVGGLTRITRDVPPFTIVEGHPSRVRGVNVIGLKRAGFSPAVIRAVKEAYKRLFRSDRTVAAASVELRAEFAAVPEVLRLVDFLAASDDGRQGRQSERPRGGAA